ncbi:MAG: hypothetical protein ABJE66_14590 [Deltaproteobacteria bacterium]
MSTLFAANHPWSEAEFTDGKLRVVRADASTSMPPPVPAPQLAPPAGAAPSLVFRQVACENAMIDILDRANSPHVLPSLAFRQKEHELGALFASLTPADSLELDRRLSVSSADDLLASRFARLVAERRARLIAFLRSARRRAASKPGSLR